MPVRVAVYPRGSCKTSLVFMELCSHGSVFLEAGVKISDVFTPLTPYTVLQPVLLLYHKALVTMEGREVMFLHLQRH